MNPAWHSLETDKKREKWKDHDAMIRCIAKSLPSAVRITDGRDFIWLMIRLKIMLETLKMRTCYAILEIFGKK